LFAPAISGNGSGPATNFFFIRAIAAPGKSPALTMGQIKWNI
jgi:hypothetical protein